MRQSQQRNRIEHPGADLAGWLRALLRVVLLACALLGSSANAAERRIELPNGDVYEGEVLNDARTGRGVYTWADQHRYEGEFFGNRMHGAGVYYWPDGRTYTGSFVEDRREGQGTLLWPNGDRYEGQFQNNQMHGEGVFIWANTDVYRGAFENGKRTGEGTFTWHTGEIHRGAFVDGVSAGQGVFLWPDGRRFEGQFENGAKTGKGVFSWPNGRRYEGMFEADERSGLGTFYSRDGTVYRGQFASDKMHGYVVKQDPDNALDLQEWDEGQLLRTRPLQGSARCKLEIEGQQWMFESAECINGLAHGTGLAARTDGAEIIVQGRFVLGKLIDGTVERLAPEVLPQTLRLRSDVLRLQTEGG